MAFSYVKYDGDALAINFVLPFTYLDRSHIHTFVGGVELPFTWQSDTIVNLATPPPVGVQNIEFRRVTPRDVLMTTFTNGNVLFAGDLNVSALQSLYIAQEYWEQTTSAYPAGHTIDSHIDVEIGNSLAKGTLRIYDNVSKYAAIAAPGDGGVLIGDTTTNQGARWLAKGTDGYTLEVQDSATGKLSWQLGLRKLVTAAGDLLAATASGVLARLAIGANNAVLVVDTTVGTVKMAWKTTLAGLTQTNPTITTGTATSTLLVTPTLSGTVTGTYTFGGTPTMPGTLIVGVPCVKNPYSANSKTTQAHGLGALPVVLDCYLQCLTAELGYNVNDVVFNNVDQGSGFGFSVTMDATNTYILTNGAIAVIHKTTPAGYVTATNANWAVIAQPYKRQL